MSVSVFFGGTSSSYVAQTTQIELLGLTCDAVDVTNEDPLAHTRNVKLLFDGVGVTNGFMGVVFASGLQTQVARAVAVVEALLAREAVVSVTAVGLSRGGCGALLLAKALQRFGEAVRVRLLAFDPVPGNAMSTVAVDVAGATLCRQCWDLSAVSCVVEAMVLFPFEPLADHLLHAPVVPVFHARTHVVFDVLLGYGRGWVGTANRVSHGIRCHQGAIYGFSFERLEQRAAYCQMREFLERSCLFRDDARVAFNTQSVVLELDAFCKYATLGPSVRHAHCYSGGITIVARPTGARYLNEWHRRCANGNSEEPTLLAIEGLRP